MSSPYVRRWPIVDYLPLARLFTVSRTVFAVSRISNDPLFLICVYQKQLYNVCLPSACIRTRVFSLPPVRPFARSPAHPFARSPVRSFTPVHSIATVDGITTVALLVLL